MKKVIQHGVYSTASELEIRDVIRTGDYDAYELEIEFIGIESITGDVRLRFVRSDGQQIVTAPIMVVENVIKYEFPTNVTALPSPLHMYVQFVDSNLYTPLHVLFSGVESIPNDDGIPESNEYIELAALIEDVESAEALRVASEENRVAAEAEREAWFENAQDGSFHTHDNKFALDDVIGINTGDQVAGDFNHNELASMQGGVANEYYHLTSAEKTIVENTSGTNTGDQDLSGYAKLDDMHNHANQTALDAVSGINTGDQVFIEEDPIFLSAAFAASHYTGFADRDHTSISFDDASCALSLTANHDAIWIDGQSYYINTTTKALSVAQQLVSGLYWFWVSLVDGVPMMNCSTSAPGFDKCIVATVYWNATTLKGILSDERHWMGRDKWMHEYLHETVGARYAGGMAGVFTNTSISIGAGEFYDEDIEHEWEDPITGVRVMYHDGGDAWKWDDLVTPYKLVGGVLQYNNGNALASVPNNRYVNYFVFATADVSKPIQVFLGTTTYTTQALATAALPPSMGVLGTAENKLIYRLTFQNNGGSPLFITATDYRTSSSLGTSGYIATDHGTLSGLSDQDHPASAIRFTPVGTMTSSDVQAAIAELYAMISGT